MADDNIKLLPEIEQLTEKLLADPKSRVFAQLADAYRKCGMFDEAIDTAKKGLEIHPQYAVAHLILGRCYMAKKMYALAREEFELTVRNDPQNLVGYRLLAETYERQNMYPEAIKFYQMVLDLDPTNIDIAEKVDNLKGAVKREEPQRPQPSPQTMTEPEPPAPPETEPVVQQEPAAASVMPEPPSPAPEIMEPAASEPEAISIEPVEAFALPGESQAAPKATAGETSISPEPSAPVPEEKAKEPSGTTATLAELYASQGHFEKAVEAYRELIAAEPENQAYKARMDELLAKAFPELSPAPELELSPTPTPSPETAATPAPTPDEAKPVEQQAVELTGMFAEMEKLAAVAEPAPPKLPEEAISLDSAMPQQAATQTIEQEPAAAALSALFAEESPPAPPAAPPAAAAPAAKEERPAEAADEPKENAVSSFQAWLNSIQK